MGRFPFFGKKKKTDDAGSPTVDTSKPPSASGATSSASASGKPPTVPRGSFLQRASSKGKKAQQHPAKHHNSQSTATAPLTPSTAASSSSSAGEARLPVSALSSNTNNTNSNANPTNKPQVIEEPPHPDYQYYSISEDNVSTGDEDNSSHHSGSSSKSSSNFKKASLRRSGSISSGNPKSLAHSTSAIGLDEMIEDRREIGTLGQNVVHIEVPFGKPIEEVYDGVHNGPVLGSGISGMVRLVTHKATGLKYAVKVLDLGLVETPTGLQQLREEIFIMCQLDHPNIVRLEEVYESHAEIYLVQELCLGGELFDRLDEQPDYHYTEAECARLVKQMLSAVRYLHSKGIIHRDLKLENFLFSSVHPDSELKMIDFGLSKHFSYGEVLHEAVGTPYTVAPEVIRGSYDERCDIWAIGVITFLLLSGEPPFGGCGGPEPLMTVRSNILQGLYQFEPGEIWELVSPQAIRFIKSLLVTDPGKRPTAQKAQQHEWFLEWARRRRENGDNHTLNPNVVKALVNFKEFSDMRKLLCEVLSFTLLPDQIRDLRREFEKMDTDGSGEISLSALKQVLMQNAGAGSLGALTEEEVTDIFDAMRVRKTETRIHWHEFIAAGLSQCSVDDRNLRLAFERLDADHKGYITLDDIMDLMGSDALQSEEAMRRMWGDSIKAVKCQHARITYDDFLLLMKGQTREGPSPANLVLQQQASVRSLKVVPESESLGNVSDEISPEKERRITPNNSSHLGIPIPAVPNAQLHGSASAPTTPADHKKIIDDDMMDDIGESPLSMDDDMPTLSPTLPLSPTRAGAYADVQDTVSEEKLASEMPPLVSLKPSTSGLSLPKLPAAEPLTRRRSRSLGGETDESNLDHPLSKASSFSEVSDDQSRDFSVVAEAVRDLILPEADHGAHGTAELDEVVKDQSKSALVVNRRLYRAHRQMRLAVLEASKRFEEQQALHAREMILAEREKQSPSVPHGAGLVMRHGTTKQVSSEAIRAMLARERAEQQSYVEKATRKGGRGRRTRKKTVSDMSAMLSMSSEDLGSIAAEANSATIGAGGSERTVAALSSDQFTPPTSLPGSEEFRKSNADPIVPPNGNSEKQNGQGGGTKEGTLRGATIPGEFRKTTDPFGSHGKYGAGMSSWK